MTQKLKFPCRISDHSVPETTSPRIWLSSSLTLQRNIAKYKFPSKLSKAESHTVLNINQALLKDLSELKNPQFFPTSTLDAFEKEFLFEHFLCSESFQNIHNEQGFLVDDSGQFLALLNVKNHLQFHWVDFSSDLNKAWESLSKIETAFGKQLSLAFSSKFGYLTSDLTECGTALKVSLYLHLPALIHAERLTPILAKDKNEDLTIQGLEGSLDEFVGDILVLRNKYTLGLSEETIIHELQKTALKLMAHEKSLRQDLKKEESSLLKDLIGRAYGLLAHSYQLQTREAMNALSLIKLGLDLGWVKGLCSHKVDQVIFQCPRAHLAHTLGESMSECSHLNLKRAAFIHKQLEGMSLV